MQWLIAAPPEMGQAGDAAPAIRFGTLPVLEAPPPEPPEPIDPPDRKDPPPGPDTAIEVSAAIDRSLPRLDAPRFAPAGIPHRLDASPGGGGDAQGGQVMAALQPPYPADAARRGLEGSVAVEFTVTETGRVVRPRILSADPPRVFDEAVRRAILRWSFRPRVVDGRAVPFTAVQVFSFRLVPD